MTEMAIVAFADEERRAEGSTSTAAHGKGVGSSRAEGRSDKPMDFVMMLQSMQMQKRFMEKEE